LFGGFLIIIIKNKASKVVRQSEFKIKNNKGVILGSIFRDKVGFIQGIRVKEAVRRTGVATSLYKEYENLALSRNIRRIELEVYEGNRKGIIFWEKQGFRQIGYSDKNYLKYIKNI
jgi:ribosomal protein S18 acetylase RimI-like enzyme